VDWGDGHNDESVHGPDRAADVTDHAVRFGDTGPATFMMMATHTYAEPGSYYVTVTVRDQTAHVAWTSFTEEVAEATP
jgi:PKD domain